MNSIILLIKCLHLHKFPGMNMLSIFYNLEYWKDLLATHLLDHMHIEIMLHLVYIGIQ